MRKNFLNWNGSNMLDSQDINTSVVMNNVEKRRKLREHLKREAQAKGEQMQAQEEQADDNRTQ
ncbi:MAG: hypothetical protein LBG97_08335 [Coriobacteriales bacterium]|jgi:hypothetical protein|nr:hypothetical protein [Coriobacteriales bacterium]